MTTAMAEVPPRQSDVDVVIPVYRPGSWLAKCLASLAAVRRVEVSVHLVDDDPRMPLDRAIATRAGASLIRMTRNSGFAAACNAGIRNGRAPYVLILNQDATLHADFLSILLRRMASDPQLGAVAGKVLTADSGASDSVLDSAGLAMRRGLRAFDIGQGEPDMGQYDQWRTVFGVSGAVALYRRSALEIVAQGDAVFDPRLFMYKEDVDLAWRLQRAGFRAGIDGNAIAHHHRTIRASYPKPRETIVAKALRLWAHERSKPAHMRALAWRNQWLVIAKNASPTMVTRELPYVAAYEIASLITGLILDPVGTMQARIRIVPPVLAALRHRRRSRTGSPVGRRVDAI